MLKISKFHNEAPISKDDLKECLDYIKGIYFVFEEINTKVATFDFKNTCKLAESIFFIRTDLIECEIRFKDLANLMKKILDQFDLDDCD